MGEERQQPLAASQLREQEHLRDASDRADDVSLTADDDQGAVRGERASRGANGTAAGDVEDRVVAATVAREVLERVVDHAIGAELLHQSDLRRAADTRYLGAVGL